MTVLTLFDLDHTLLPIDSDHEWGQFMVRIGAVDGDAFMRQNDGFYEQYVAGTLDPTRYLEFVFSNLARFPRTQLDQWHRQFMAEVIRPAIRPAARKLVEEHQRAGDLTAIVTATNRFVTAPIAQAFGIDNLIAAEPDLTPEGEIAGTFRGIPPYGAGKVKNLEKWLQARGLSLRDFSRSTFYSDSQNDIPLLSLVTHPVATNPNTRLLDHAKAQGWPILNLFDD